MSWTIFVTGWIILQTVVRAAQQPKLCKLKGETDGQLAISIAGTILWGLAMIGSLYMAGLYS